MEDERAGGEHAAAMTVGAVAFFALLHLVSGYLSTSFTLPGMSGTAASSTSLLVPFGYFVLFLVVSAGVLALIKSGAGGLLTGLSLFITWYACIVIGILAHSSLVGGLIGGAVGLATATVLYQYPEWHVIDAVALLWAIAGVAAVGLFITPTATIILLVLLAIYDLVAVYGTGHMADISEALSEQPTPLLVYFPSRLSLSLLHDNSTPTETLSVGLGDFAVPSLLVVSLLNHPAAFASLTTPLETGLALAVGSSAGIIVAQALLIQLADSRPLPGLPVLNAGAIFGTALPLVVFGVL